jgi:electron transport complex protein RnfD
MRLAHAAEGPGMHHRTHVTAANAPAYREATTRGDVALGNTVTLVMRRVLLAALPGIFVLTFWFGIGVLTNLLLATLFALAFETLALKLRRRSARWVLEDLSAVVTAWLLALALPPLSPWWLIAIAIGFAILVAKQLYGGLGHNPFNPAMVGYVVVLIAFPAELSAWLLPAGMEQDPPSLLQSLTVVFAGNGALDLDGATGATILDLTRTELGRGRTLTEIGALPVFGGLGGYGWEWVAMAWLGGGAWLLWKRVIRWQIPTAVIGALGLLATLFWLVDSERYASPLYHLFGGATLLGAFFIATDPVSASTTPRGRLIYGAGVGIVIWVIRTWGGYPDGVAFAVLTMNMMAPTIDYYTQPRVFGQR